MNGIRENGESYCAPHEYEGEIKPDCSRCNFGYKHEKLDVLFCTHYGEYVGVEDWKEECCEFEESN